jgi:hypothetical protein
LLDSNGVLGVSVFSENLVSRKAIEHILNSQSVLKNRYFFEYRNKRSSLSKNNSEMIQKFLANYLNSMGFEMRSKSDNNLLNFLQAPGFAKLWSLEDLEELLSFKYLRALTWIPNFRSVAKG